MCQSSQSLDQADVVALEHDPAEFAPLSLVFGNAGLLTDADRVVEDDVHKLVKATYRALDPLARLLVEPDPDRCRLLEEAKDGVL